jgi:hypothetical protein
VALALEQLVAEALGERKGDLRAIVADVVDQELQRIVGTLIEQELAARGI